MTNAVIYYRNRVKDGLATVLSLVYIVEERTDEQGQSLLAKE